MSLRQFEGVQVTHPVARYGLPAGAVGTILDVYEGGAAFEVEFPELDENDITATLHADEVAPVSLMAAAKP
jgi:hypothetical protein